MRKVSTFKNSKLQKEQFRVLAEILSSIKDKEKCLSFLNILLTQSEKVVISQRLDILRLVQKDFKYWQIQERFKTTANTIARAVDNYKSSSQKDQANFDQIIAPKKKFLKASTFIFSIIIPNLFNKKKASPPLWRARRVLHELVAGEVHQPQDSSLFPHLLKHEYLRRPPAKLATAMPVART